MKNFLKWTGFSLGLLLLVMGGLGAYIFGVTSYKLNKKRQVPDAPYKNTSYQADLKRGEYLTQIRLACVDCHGADLSGAKVIENPAVAKIYGSNITPAALKDWTDAEIVRAIRSGVGRNGKALILMPSQDYQHLSEEEMRDVVAYMRSVKPSDVPSKPSSLGPVFKALLALNKTPTMLPAQVVNHASGFPADVPEGVTPAYGKYIAQSACMGCHGTDLKGGPIPGGDPKWPPASNLTQDALGAWSEDDFLRAMRMGITPSGSVMRRPMVVNYTTRFKESDLKALWAYLKTVKGTEAFE